MRCCDEKSYCHPDLLEPTDLKNHPEWKRVWEDIFRSMYQQARIDAQVKTKGMTTVTPQDSDPYHGEFL